ncbi:hypothetical protein [Malacoplasma muris]|uniref:hypothetical protein n=1 Tax=Malacoplasma muris TaxID=2119 RepID=UPI00398E5105
MKVTKKEKKQSDLISSHSNRGESLQKEMKLQDSSSQWDEIKKIHENEVSSVILEQEILKREKEAEIEKKKIFIEMQEQKMTREEDEFNRVIDIENKIKNKKKREMKRRDIAFRNKSILG